MTTAITRLMLALTAALLAGGASANLESVCGTTTHGIPLKKKAASIDWNDKSTEFFKALGPGQIHEYRNGSDIVIWYDIMHIRSNSRSDHAGVDCGVMIALATQGKDRTVTMRSLLAEDIRILLTGKSPNY